MLSQFRGILPAAILALVLPGVSVAASQTGPIEECPGHRAFGNTAHSDILEFGIGESVRRLHFERILVFPLQDQRFKLVIPRVLTGPQGTGGWVNADPASAQAAFAGNMGKDYASAIVDIDLNAVFASGRFATRSLSMPGIDCLQNHPELSLLNLFDGRRSEITLSIDPDFSGRWLEIESRDRESDAWMKISVSSRPIERQVVRTPIDHQSFPHDLIEAHAVIARNGAVMYVDTHVVEESDGSATVFSSFTVPFPASGRRVARPGREYTQVYDFLALGDDHAVVAYHHVPGTTADDRIIDRASVQALRDVSEYELTERTLQRTVAVTSVEHLSADPLWIESEETARPALFGLADIPKEVAAPAVRTAIAAGRTLFAFDGELLELTARDSTVGGRNLLAISFSQADARDLVVRAVESRLRTIVGEDGLEALLSIFVEGGPHADTWASTGVREPFLHWFGEALGRMGLPSDAIDELADPEEAFMILEDHLGKQVLEAAISVLEARQRSLAAVHADTFSALREELVSDDPNVAQVSRLLRAAGLRVPESIDPAAFIREVNRIVHIAFGSSYIDDLYHEVFGREETRFGVLIDPHSGLPAQRYAYVSMQPEELSLDVTAVFDGPGVSIAARNVAQGPDALDIQMPSGVMDGLQPLVVIPYLDLSNGHSRDIFLLELEPSISVSYTMDESRYLAQVSIGGGRMSISSSHLENVSIGDKELRVLRLNVLARGALPAPLEPSIAHLTADGSYAFEMLVMADSPHHLLLVEGGHRHVRVAPLGDSRLPDEAAIGWLLDLP